MQGDALFVIGRKIVFSVAGLSSFIGISGEDPVENLCQTIGSQFFR